MANELAVLRQRLDKGEKLATAWLSLPEPALAGVFAAAGFDLVTLDMQHGMFDFMTTVRAIESARLAGAPAFVRIGVGDFAVAAQLLDAGANGIVAPMINSAADAKLFASFIKYPPRGERSWGPYRAQRASGLDASAFLAEADKFSLAIAMIETAAAVDALDDILAVEGIDGVLVGPNDLSIGLSKGAIVDAESAAVDAALTKVAERAKAHGKIACAFCLSGERARELFARGFHICSVGNDVAIIGNGVSLSLNAARRSPPAAGKSGAAGTGY